MRTDGTRKEFLCDPLLLGMIEVNALCRDRFGTFEGGDILVEGLSSLEQVGEACLGHYPTETEKKKRRTSSRGYQAAGKWPIRAPRLK